MYKIKFLNLGATCTIGIVNHFISENQTDELKSCTSCKELKAGDIHE